MLITIQIGTTPPLVSTEWISMLSSPAQEGECPADVGLCPRLEFNTVWTRLKPSNGSRTPMKASCSTSKGWCCKIKKEKKVKKKRCASFLNITLRLAVCSV